MYGALENHMMAAHGCVVPYIVSEKPICTDSKAINDTFWIAWNRVTNQVRQQEGVYQTNTPFLGGGLMR